VVVFAIAVKLLAKAIAAWAAPARSKTPQATMHPKAT